MQVWNLPQFLRLEEHVEYMTDLETAVTKDEEDKHRQQER